MNLYIARQCAIFSVTKQNSAKPATESNVTEGQCRINLGGKICGRLHYRSFSMKSSYLVK